MAKKKKDTLDLYQILEILNKKINSNTIQIENNSEQQKIQLDETKIYLLEEINNKINSISKSISNKLEVYKKEIYKNLDYKQEILVSESFKKLKADISNDLEELANKVMNSRIL